MKILIFTKKETQFIKKRLVDEARERNHQITLASYEELRFRIGDKFGIFTSDQELGDDYDAVILRIAPSGVMVYYKDLLARSLGQKNFVVNGESFVKWPYLGKITQNFLLAQAGLPIIQSQIFARRKELLASDFEFPLVAKKHFGKLGNSVFKAQSKSELAEILGGQTPEFLIQPFLATGEDYRVIVLGGKALPKVMKKVAPEGQLATNISRGGIAVAEEISDELKKGFDEYC